MADWNSFTKRIFIDQPTDKVYESWAKPGLLTQWFLEKAEYAYDDGQKRQPDEFIQSGDRHEWKWNNWDVIEEGTVLKANDKDHLSFTFGKGGNVHIDLHEKDGGTELVLVQDNIPTDDEGKMNYYVGCNTGWTFWLTNLKAWLEHDITLHATRVPQSETDNLVNS
jgi:uncharacterized protein YndB with AHSA1/START domain